MPTPIQPTGWLDRLALASGAAAAAALAAMAIVLGAQIALRLAGRQIPAADDFAAWAMSASVFLALPYAMQRGEHIRVMVLLNLLPPAASRALDVLATALALLLSGWAAFHLSAYVAESWQAGEVAQGMVRVPLWTVQWPMACGSGLLLAIVARRLLRLVRGLPPAAADAAARSE